MDAMRKGDATLDAVKRRTRAGMGYCQGKTCKGLIAAMLAAYYEMPVDEFLPGSIRMPVGAVKLSVLAEALESPGSGGR
jgi:hypothetical protein